MIWIALIVVIVAIALISHYNSLSGFRVYNKDKTLDE